MKRLLLTPVFVLMMAVVLVGQTTGLSFSVKVNNCNEKVANDPKEITEIEADFRADRTFGPAPLTVQFTDRSSGDIDKWLWNFGDGTTDSVQNPTHIYQQEGVYTIKLSVFKYGADTIVSVDSRSDFIRVVGYGLCDSVNYDIPGNYYLYQLPGAETGYLSGNNSRGDLAKASYFEISEEKGILMGGLFYFAIKENGLATDPDIVFKAWDNDGPLGTPGTVLDEATVLLSEIQVDDQGTGFYPATIPFFDEWAMIDNSFYLGFELPQTAGDTLAVFTNKTDDVLVGNGWEQTATGAWQPYEDGTPGYKVDNAIFPIICQPTGIDNHILLENRMIIYPIPAKDQLFVNVFEGNPKKMSATIFDLSGRMVAPAAEIHSGSSLNVSQLNTGLYLLRIETSDGVSNHKIMIE